jgi:hypothetical protein
MKDSLRDRRERRHQLRFSSFAREGQKKSEEEKKKEGSPFPCSDVSINTHTHTKAGQ